MAYLHIHNLYKDQTILMFKRVFAMEKIHGTSAHITYVPQTKELTFFSGGEKHDKFVSLFDKEALLKAFESIGFPIDSIVTVFGEAYGGSCQGFSHTYGKDLKFIAFDIQIGDCWLDVPKAEGIVKQLGLEFVDYVEVSTELTDLDAERDKPSTQAIRNGVSSIDADGKIVNPRPREGVVLRPLIEMTLNNGSRVIVKHKGDAFKETKTARPIVDPSKMLVINEANAVADEWVTQMRLTHVLDKMPGHSIEKMKDIIKAMTEDVIREGAGEFVDTPEVRKAIGQKTAIAYKNYLKTLLVQAA